MIRDDRIDVMTVSVKAPAHRELVLAALEAGKPVYCEAPLGRSVAETEEMASAVGSLHTASGLQGRLNPTVRRAAQLPSSGRIGRPLSAKVVSSLTGYGPEKTSSGANLLTISAGHTLVWWKRSSDRSSRSMPGPRFCGPGHTDGHRGGECA